jgi:excisionase family DNA binding protein
MTNQTILLRPRRDREVAQETTDEHPRPLLVTSTDAARVLAIGRTTLYELVKSGDLTPIHLRRCVRFSMHEIEQLVASRRRAA